MVAIKKIMPKAPILCGSCPVPRSEPWPGMSPEAMYELSIGKGEIPDASVLLCRDCMRRLGNSIHEDAVRDGDLYAFAAHFFQDAYPDGLSKDPEERASQKGRLMAALSPVPDTWKEVLYRFYTGEWLEESLLHYVLAGAFHGDGPAQEEAFRAAKEWLACPARLEFVLTGRSDLETAFSKAAAAYLTEYHAFVISDVPFFDLETSVQLSGAGILSREAKACATPETFQEIRSWQEANGQGSLVTPLCRKYDDPVS